MCYPDDGFGLAVLAGTRLALQRHGLDVVTARTFRRGTTAVDTGLALLLDSQPDVVVMAGSYTPIAAFIRAARREGLKARLASVSFVGTADLPRRVGDEGDGPPISQAVPLPRYDREVIRDWARLIEQRFPGEHADVAHIESCIDAKIMPIDLERAGPSKRPLPAIPLERRGDAHAPRPVPQARTDGRNDNEKGGDHGDPRHTTGDIGKTLILGYNRGLEERSNHA